MTDEIPPGESTITMAAHISFLFFMGGVSAVNKDFIEIWGLEGERVQGIQSQPKSKHGNSWASGEAVQTESALSFNMLNHPPTHLPISPAP